MQFIVYFLTYPFLFLISKLPFKILYFLSDVSYLFVYYVFRYRKSVVRENLKLAFPHFTNQERLQIEKKSYRHLCDMFLEMIKTISITDKEIEERFAFKNLDLYLSLEKQGKSIALMCGHYASYEWVLSMNRKINFTGFGIYKKLNNVYFDNFVIKVRSKFKTTLISSKIATSEIEKNQINGIKGVYGFASDQSPENKIKNFWTSFMGLEVPFYTGAELLAHRYDLNVIFLKVTKVKRGFYVAEFENMQLDRENIKQYPLTVDYIRKVEKQIYEKPEFYLWTHKRFKHLGKRHLAN